MWCCYCGEPLPPEEEKAINEAMKDEPPVCTIFRCLKCAREGRSDPVPDPPDMRPSYAEWLKSAEGEQ